LFSDPLSSSLISLTLAMTLTLNETVCPKKFHSCDDGSWGIEISSVTMGDSRDAANSSSDRRYWAGPHLELPLDLKWLREGIPRWMHALEPGVPKMVEAALGGGNPGSPGGGIPAAGGGGITLAMRCPSREVVVVVGGCQ
jgi:hypothetical protein